MYSKEGQAPLRGQERSRKVETRGVARTHALLLNCSNCLYRPYGVNRKTFPLRALPRGLLLARTPHSHPQKLVAALALRGGGDPSPAPRLVTDTARITRMKGGLGSEKRLF